MATPAASPRATLGLACLLGVLGAVLLFIAWDGIAQLVGGVRAGAGRLVVRTGAAAAIPAAMMLIALAALIVYNRPATDRNARRLFAIVVASAPFLLLLPLALFVSTNALLPDKGYRRCVDPEGGQRFLAVEWIRTGAGAGSPQTCGQQPTDR